MCVIVDANLAAAVFGNSGLADFRPVVEWISSPKKNGQLVAGGQLVDELSRVAGARRYLRSLQQAGRVRLIPDEEVRKEERRVHNSGLCQSNDHHVIALARVSGARTLCSNDRDLCRDFKNPQIISKPRGHIYRNSRHIHLLKHTRSCRKRG